MPRPFEPGLLEEERSDTKDYFRVSLNKEERAELDADKRFLRQPMDSTAIKQLAELGRIVTHEPIIRRLVLVILKNKQRNKRTGIAEIE